MELVRIFQFLTPVRMVPDSIRLKFKSVEKRGPRFEEVREGMKIEFRVKGAVVGLTISLRERKMPGERNSTFSFAKLIPVSLINRVTSLMPLPHSSVRPSVLFRRFYALN